MVLFENTYSRDEGFFKEIYFHHYYKSRFFLICEIVVGISFFANLLFLLFDSEPYYYAFIYAILLPMIQFWGYRRSVKISMAREKEISTNETIVYTITVSEDKITSKTSLGTEYVIDFSRIKSVYKTMNYIMLQTSAKQLIALKKDSFSISDSEEFFLRKKGYKI